MLNELIYKQPLVVFLGAGASAPLGMKTTVQFIEWVKSLPEIDYSLMTQIIHEVKPSDEVGKKVDIEAVLDYLEKLIDAREAYEKLLDIHLTSVDKFDKIIKLRDRIQDLVIAHYSEIDASKAFRHYRPLLQGLPIPILPIFTTNYDLSIEKAYEHSKAQLRLRLIDGFERTRVTIPRWSETSYKHYKPRAKSKDIILFKLHGSVDWHRTLNGEIQRIEAHQRNPGILKTVVAYPSRTKKEIHEEPFRTNYDYLLACLAHAKVCLVIGFSFRDQEIVEHFREAAGINSDLRVEVVDLNKHIANYVVSRCNLSGKVGMMLISEEHVGENIQLAVPFMRRRLQNIE